MPGMQGDFITITCPKCQLTSLMTQKAYDRHLVICTGRGYDSKPVKDTPTEPVVSPAPVEQPPTYYCSTCSQKHPTKQERTECRLAFEKRMEESKIAEADRRAKAAAEQEEAYKKWNEQQREMMREVQARQAEFKRKEDEKAAEYARQLTLLEEMLSRPSMKKREACN